jgi:hypothetical protein
MTPDRHGRIHEIFNAALELASDSRAAYLDSARGGDVELRDFVQNLIEANSGTVTASGPGEEQTALVVLECPRCTASISR